ncbi:M56 family metallopeptidase [Dyadobacter sp. CY261]|uniref:M56 family metallopeptidase n=1 Tax=Dyadobacter sp. CY261 TaxID=2907203 RepID=UPI001F1E437F|nr:M56 family metallopeptidase [Dyadobacter sp. CY261]MCF0073485.1 M56 family metallopeptidase [Dyadobacter sp. CY261]
MNSYLNSENVSALIQRIGIALGHSLWIGAVVATLAAMVIILTRRSRPEVRYNLLTGLMLMFLAATTIAFLRSGEAFSSSAKLLGEASSYQSATITTSPQAQLRQPGSIAIVREFLATNIHLITLLWLIVVIARSAGLVLGFYRLYQLKTQQIYSIGRHWEQRVGKFAAAMGIMRPVRILQSGLAQVPMVLGHFKPVILVPLGAITSIPADQIEMVLLHELAHIRRLDFFVNFIQRITELLFFFNPGILWISRLIREEREHCCDDMALRYSGNQAVYINALLSFREYQLSNGVYELAFTGKSGLIQRAKRIASRSNSTLGTVEKTVLAFTMLAFFTFSILYAQSHEPQKIDTPVHRFEKVTSQQVPLKNTSGVKVTTDKNSTQKAANNLVNQNTKNTPNPANLSIHDTLRPLRNTLSPIYEPASLTLSDSSGKGRVAPVLRQPYVQTYEMQPLQTYQPLFEDKPLSTKSLSISEKILAEIELQGVVISRTDITFKITNTELIINGIKQPETIHQGILSAVLSGPGDIINFTYGSHK